MFLSNEENLSKRLDFEVVKKALFNAEGSEITTHYQLVNGNTDKQIGIMNNSYTPYYNELFVEKVNEISKASDMQFCGYHVWREDCRIIAVFKKEDVQILGHEHNRYVGLINSHDGSHAIKLLHNLVMKRCTNGLTTVHGESPFRIKHTSGSYLKMKQELDATFKQFDESLEAYQKDAELLQSEEIGEKELAFMLDVMTKASKDTKTTRMSNLQGQMRQAYKTEAADLGENCFAFLQGQTRFANEKLIKNSGFAAFYGTAADHNAKAYRIAMKVANLLKTKQSLSLLKVG